MVLRLGTFVGRLVVGLRLPTGFLRGLLRCLAGRLVVRLVVLLDVVRGADVVDVVGTVDVMNLF